MDKRFEPLATGEVLSVDESVQILIGHRTFRVGEFAEAIKAQLEYVISGWTQEKDGWFSEEGIPCEVLRFTAQGWQKGKVRINLEFCPLDPGEDYQQAVASFDHESAVAEPSASMSDDLNFDEPSTSMPDEFDLEASAATPAALDIEESFTSTQYEFHLETPVASDDELDQEEPNVLYAEMEQQASTTFPDDEFGMTDPISSSLDDEFGMTDPMSTSLDDEFGMTDPMSTSLDDEFGMADPMSTSLDDEFGMANPMSTSLDDEFDQISESIEQELELVETPQASSDDLLDLGDMSTDSDDDLDFGDMSIDSDENMDFGETSASGEGEFQFEEISFNSDLEDDGTDSLLDDVWQDINQPSWQNNQ